ncbi:MAG: hypothetical protein AMXMBFR34_34140 [Myxococcaceae bacterium]
MTRRSRWRVRLTSGAADELSRLFEFEAARDLASAPRMRVAMANAFVVLERLPFSARPARLAQRATLRELLVPHGRSGYVMLLEVEKGVVTASRIRHQLESDDD